MQNMNTSWISDFAKGQADHEIVSYSSGKRKVVIIALAPIAFLDSMSIPLELQSDKPK